MSYSDSRQHEPRVGGTGTVFLIAGLLVAGGASSVAGQPTPGYNNKIPESIMTPDKVETRIGTLEFFDGVPTKRTAELCYDNLNFLPGPETFVNGMPAASLEAIRRGQTGVFQGDRRRSRLNRIGRPRSVADSGTTTGKTF